MVLLYQHKSTSCVLLGSLVCLKLKESVFLLHINSIVVIQPVFSPPEFSKVQRSFAQTLGSFRFQTIGEQTEDEKMIG